MVATGPPLTSITMLNDDRVFEPGIEKGETHVSPS